MSAEYICDGCGKRAPAVVTGAIKSWGKPWKWYQRADKEDGGTIQDACSRKCIEKVAEETGKTNLVLPL